jgi:2-polyprenyl-6-methoxyphenol hydroxylase-like FAD-dependent oxidoreductase
MQRSERAVVIGGGIGGMATAAALVNAGVDAAVFEQSPELGEIGAGVGLQIRAMKALREMKLFEAVLDIGEQIQRLEIRSWNGRRLASIPVAEISRELGAPALVVHRAELLDVLARGLLDAGRVTLGARCVSVRDEGDTSTATFEDGSEQSGSLLVGADGVRSVVRRTVVGDTELREPGFLAWRAMPQFEHDAVAGGVAHIAIGRGRLFGLFPGSRGRTFWFGSGIPRRDGDLPRDQWKSEALKDYEGWFEPVETVIEATDVSQIYRNPLYDRKPLTSWGSGRITLVGDAAHPMLPTLGQGAGQAVEDAAALATQVGRVGDIGRLDRLREAIEAYEAERIPPTSGIVNESWSLGKTYHWNNPIACWVRDTGFRIVPNSVWRRRSASGRI